MVVDCNCNLWSGCKNVFERHHKNFQVLQIVGFQHDRVDGSFEELFHILKKTFTLKHGFEK